MENKENTKSLKVLYIAKGIIEHCGRYLVLKRAREQAWELPGGRIRGDEDPHAALKREVLEETGLSIEILKELRTMRGEHNGLISVCHLFLCGTDSTNTKLSAEHTDFKWIKAEDFKNLKLVRFADKLIPLFEALSSSE